MNTNNYQMKTLVTALLLCCLSVAAKAEGYVVQPFWNGWYVQAGLDMSLQNPYGCNFSDVFPHGKTFGVEAGVGKWFTPEIGLRLDANWENGIGLLNNGHADWLGPFGQPGENHRKGGYLLVVGNVMFDLHNILFGYDAKRRWHLQLFPRAGAAYCFGVSKGSPLLGIGVGSTYQLNERWGLYIDATYDMVSSGFAGSNKNTGTGSNSNGFFKLGVGATFNLGKLNNWER